MTNLLVTHTLKDQNEYLSIFFYIVNQLRVILYNFNMIVIKFNNLPIW